MKQRRIILAKCSIKMFLLLIALFSCLYMYAQPQTPQKKKERIEAEKIAFITKILDLTPQEAQVFWPVYNQYQKEYDELRAKHKEQIAKRKNMQDMTDNEVTELVDSEIVFRQEELDLQRKYHAKFKTVLPIRKVAKLYYAENQFKKELLQRIKEQNSTNR